MCGWEYQELSSEYDILSARYNASERDLEELEQKYYQLQEKCYELEAENAELKEKLYWADNWNVWGKIYLEDILGFRIFSRFWWESCLEYLRIILRRD